MPDQYFVDTNVLLRLLLDDHPTHSPAARELFCRAAQGRISLAVVPSTLSEVVFVLGGSGYGHSREQIATALERLMVLPWTMTDRSGVGRAIELFRDEHPDWDDCLLAAYALRDAEGHIVSFDRGLDRIPGVERYDPLSNAAT